MRHIISILLQNEAGALTRVASLFSSRGYNIESLSVAPTDDPELSRLTLVTFGSDEVIDQINKQLFKLIDVVNIADMTKGDHIEREQLLLKVRLAKAQSALLDEIIAEFNADVIDPNPENFTLVVTGTVSRIDEFVERAGKATELLTVVRSGAMAIARGEQILSAAI
ncbi:MAG: acetolactate synthase small subunit [Chromatiales bacterium]|jgi:acetolactate synthase-1/3 small subunit|nr:acetolactate synthase small subunit [Chromatiales bacterium]